MAAEHHPNWDNLSQGARKLHARNSHQVMGQDLNSPSQFVLAWTPGGKGEGGTGQAIRLAKANGVQVLDLGDPEVLARMQRFVGEGEPSVASAATSPVAGTRPAPGPRSFSNAGENGFPAGDQPVVLKDGTVVGSGYSRVIHGGRGDYVELLPEHVDRNSLTSKYGDPNAPLPERAYYRWMEAGPNKTKVYEQAKGVGYADYKPGRYYIDPADLQGFDGTATSAVSQNVQASIVPPSETRNAVAEVANDATLPPRASNSRMLRANMNFPFKGQARPEVTAKNTFDAIKNGERTATTTIRCVAGHREVGERQARRHGRVHQCGRREAPRPGQVR